MMIMMSRRVESDTSIAEEDDTAVEVEGTQAGALDNEEANVL